jgi:hypothetical protein
MGLSICARVLAAGLLLGVPGLVATARAEPAPKHGGTLVFAVDAEPENGTVAKLGVRL